MTTWRPGPTGPSRWRSGWPPCSTSRQARQTRHGRSAGAAVHSRPAARSSASVVLPTPSGPTNRTACGAGPRTMAATASSAAACPRVRAPSMAGDQAGSVVAVLRVVRRFGAAADAPSASTRRRRPRSSPRPWPWRRPACAPPAAWAAFAAGSVDGVSPTTRCPPASATPTAADWPSTPASGSHAAWPVPSRRSPWPPACGSPAAWRSSPRPWPRSSVAAARRARRHRLGRAPVGRLGAGFGATCARSIASSSGGTSLHGSFELRGAERPADRPDGRGLGPRAAAGSSASGR